MALVAIVSLVVRQGPADSGATVLPPGVPRVVFAEFGLNEDRIYSAPADNPDDRTLHATVSHAPGWGLNPALGTAGTLVAYTILPEDAAPDRGVPAELWVLDISTRNLTRLARDADLLAPPVFVDGGSALVYRRSRGALQELVRVDVASMTREVVHEEQTTFGIFPLGLDRTGHLLFYRLSTEGTDLYTTNGGDTRWLFRASPDIARDWQVAPDGAAVAFLAPSVELERAVYRVRVVSLDTLEDITPADGLDREATNEAMALSLAATEQYGPVWLPDGSGVAIGREPALGEPAAAVVLGVDGSRETLPPPEQGFDVPLGWSEDGRYLAVRSFDGQGSAQAGFDTTVIVDRTGSRYPVRVASEVIFLGWYSRV
jgi:hypothetical protein